MTTEKTADKYPFKTQEDRDNERQRGHSLSRVASEKFQRSDGKVIGISGLKVISGRINEEWNIALKDYTKRMKVFAEMREDITVGTMLDAIKIPILATHTTVEVAAQGSDADKKAAEWLELNLFNMDRQEWVNHVEDALGCLEYGFAIGEIIIEKRLDGRMWLKNIEPRGQETLEKWKFDEELDETTHFIQTDPNSYGATFEIPLTKCVHVTYRSRKGNPEGAGILRSVFRPWRFCKDLENLEAIGIERDVGGMPVATLPEGDISPDDMNKLKAALKGVRMDEEMYLIVPFEVKVDAYGGGGKIYDVGAVIDRKKKEILGRVFAQFLMLGMGEVGTQALVQGSQDFFTLGLEAIQRYLEQAWNMQLVPYLFSFNSFPGIVQYPKIKMSKPGKIDVAALLSALNTASGAKIFTPTDLDEEHVRNLLDMPELPEEEKDMPRDTEVAIPGIFDIRNQVKKGIEDAKVKG